MRQGLAFEQLCDVETEAARMLQGATACQLDVRSNRKPGINWIMCLSCVILKVIL